jgi:hypothetical protein
MVDRTADSVIPTHMSEHDIRIIVDVPCVKTSLLTLADASPPLSTPVGAVQ